MSSRQTYAVLVTCEHGGNDVPQKYQSLFDRGGAADLNSHRGWDPGALVAARLFAKELDSPLLHGSVTRLLVDLNRSEFNPDLFSKYSNRLDEDARNELLEQYYRPYRRTVCQHVGRRIGEGMTCLHVSVHTFTPRYRGQRRDVRVGILFDPKRPAESAFATRWCKRLAASLPHVCVRENQPYLGTDDGLTTELRRVHSADQYIGIEIEIANSFAKRTSSHQRRRVQTFAAALPRTVYER